jgi:LuxR family transcriptional regulator, maltose regulon positive regulatory protein
MTTTILIVDDHPLFRKGLHLIFEEEQDMRVVGEAGDGQEAIERVRELSPDVVVMDISMPNLNGMEATRRILMESPDTKIVALSIHDGKRFVKDMLSAGAAGYILKDSVPEELTNGIRKVMRGEVYLSSVITGVVVSEYVSLLSGDREAEKDPATLQEVNADSAISIVKTKLYQPPCPEEHVHRAHSTDKLDRNRSRPLILVSAPAGYGKTTLVTCWLESCERLSAWLSVDENDSDLRQFMSYFVAALQTLFPEKISDTAALVWAPRLPPIPILADTLLNELDRIEQDFIMVLDDVHNIREKSVYDFLDYLLRHPPRSMQLVMVGRRDPAIPIATLRANSLMTEVRMRDLQFNADEAAEFLQKAIGRHIEKSTAEAVMEKAEGWVTGLRLAALAMRGQDGNDRKMLELKGTTHYVMDYLVGEVLDNQPPGIRHCLLSTSILNRFSAPLCEVLFQTDKTSATRGIDGEEFINWLQSENIFVVSLDTENRWFRYHHLFQDLLQSQLKRRLRFEEISTLHSLASEWFEGRGLIDEALEFGLAAGDVEQAAKLVERHRQFALDHNQWFSLEKWLTLLPETVVQERTELLMARAWVYLFHFRFDAIFPLLDRVESLLDQDSAQKPLRGEIALMRGYVLYFLGDGASSLKYIEKALEQIPSSFYEARAQSEVIFALANQMQGRKERALRGLDDLIVHYDSLNMLQRSRLLVTYVYVHLTAGDLAKAGVSNRKLLNVATESRSAYVEGWVAYLQGLIHLHKNELEAAVEFLRRSVAQRFVYHKKAAADAITALMLAYQALGRPDEVRETQQLLREYVASLDDPLFWTLVASSEVRLGLMQGRSEPAVRWLEQGASPDDPTMLWWLDLPSITYCRALITVGSPARLDEAEERLRALTELAEGHHNTVHLIEILSLRAVALQKRGKAEEALTVLKRALTLARPGGFVFGFLEFGPPLADLLNRLVKKNVLVDYIGEILSACRNVETGTGQDVSDDQSVQRSSISNQALVEPLTNRELEVIDLLAQRMSNKEIAAKLFISPETVKRHTINIYQKLGVNSRREAVDKAHALDLLSE